MKTGHTFYFEKYRLNIGNLPSAAETGLDEATQAEIINNLANPPPKRTRTVYTPTQKEESIKNPLK